MDTKPFDRKAHCRAIAARGGQTTARKPGHMSTIGKRGFVALAQRLGDNGAAVSYLQTFQGMPKRPRSQWTKNAFWG